MPTKSDKKRKRDSGVESKKKKKKVEKEEKEEVEEVTEVVVQENGQKEKEAEEETPRPTEQVNMVKELDPKDQKLIVVLDGANLETVKRRNDFELLNSDDHGSILRANRRDLNDARPDITHQCLLSLLDSPLNKAGKLQIYIHTQRNVLIEVHPQIRIPRTFKRFSGLMVQLLHKLTIRASDGPMQLLKVVKNPVTQYFPVGCPKIGFERGEEKLIDINQYVRTLPPGPLVFVIGAFARGDISPDYVEEQIAISSYPLSGASVCSKVCFAMEQMWGVL